MADGPVSKVAFTKIRFEGETMTEVSLEDWGDCPAAPEEAAAGRDNAKSRVGSQTYTVRDDDGDGIPDTERFPCREGFRKIAGESSPQAHKVWGEAREFVNQAKAIFRQGVARQSETVDGGPGKCEVDQGTFAFVKPGTPPGWVDEVITQFFKSGTTLVMAFDRTGDGTPDSMLAGLRTPHYGLVSIEEIPVRLEGAGPPPAEQE